MVSVMKFCRRRMMFLIYQSPFLVVELAECSPLIIQNNSNLSSRKNLDVWLYDHKTVQGGTLNMHG